MAEGKKSFIAYSDWKDVFDALPNEDAGALIKHIFAYVNDEQPVTDSVLLNAVFANIKSTLKRDLKKWQSQLEQRSKAGKKSAEVRRTKFNERSNSFNETQRISTVNDNVTVTDNVNDTVTNKYKSNFENDYVTDEKVCRENGFDEKQLAKAKFEFWNTKELDAEMLGKTYQDVQKHFLNWCRKNKDRIKKLEQGVKQPLPPSSKKKLN